MKVDDMMIALKISSAMTAAQSSPHLHRADEVFGFV
jgi:hypothetical protein